MNPANPQNSNTSAKNDNSVKSPPPQPESVKNNFEQYQDYFGAPEQQINTLDESICTTICREIKMVAHKLSYVLIPSFRDLWGPMIFTMVLASILSLNTTENNNIYPTVFLIVWGGALLLTINCNLLGGNAHYLQCLCVLGYCIFPIVLGCGVIIFCNTLIHRFYIKASIAGFAFLWSCQASTAFMQSIIDPEKKALSMFPVVLFFLFLSCFCLFL